MPARPSGLSSIYQGRAADLPIRARLSGQAANRGGAAGRRLPHPGGQLENEGMKKFKKRERETVLRDKEIGRASCRERVSSPV